MSATWVVIANASQAFIYTLDDEQLRKKQNIVLELHNSLEHPESRKKDGELIQDRSGHFQSGNLGHGSYVNPVDPKDHEAEVFAKQIADALESARVSNKFTQLILIVPPRFHGLLNKHLNKNVMSLVSKKIEKDYTKNSLKELEEHLKRYLLKS